MWKPTGTRASISDRTPPSESGSALASSESRAAIIPQPMSTPTAAGTIAPRVGMTEPMVDPIPTWTSGIAATCECTNGRRATCSSCRTASGVTSSVQMCTGTGVWSMVRLTVMASPPGASLLDASIVVLRDIRMTSKTRSRSSRMSPGRIGSFTPTPVTSVPWTAAFSRTQVEDRPVELPL